MTIPGTRGRIGFLWPADGLNDDEFLAFVPPGVAWLTARYDAGTETEELSEAVLDAYAEPEVLRRGARLLRACHPDVVACGDQAASFIRGAAGERAMAGAVAEALGCPVVTMSAAAVGALAELGARRVALVSPYSAEVTGALVAYLAEHGIAACAVEVAGAASEEDIGTRAPHDWLPEAVRAARAAGGEAQALFLAGGGVRFAAAITACEAATGLPVVTGPGALVRAAVRRLGLEAERPGLGRLFRPAGAPAIELIAARQSTGTKSFAVSDRPPVFVAAAGARLVDETGRAWLDFACGSGTTALGHGHPAIAAALREQLATGVLHLGPHFHAPVQARLYARLAGLLPPHLDRFHPSVSGAEATEVALKAAMHATGARRFVGFEGGYHGRTFGALSVSGARGRNAGLGPFAPEAEILPFPSDAATGAEVAARIRDDGRPLAAVIVEPVQATAGLRIGDPAGLAAIAAAARDVGALLLVDEVFTGFGRTGRMFAFEAAGLEPDLAILGKSFGGGLPAGLVAGRASVLAAWPTGVQTSTFQLHPAAAATALAFLDVLEGEGLVARAAGRCPRSRGRRRWWRSAVRAPSRRWRCARPRRRCVCAAGRWRPG